MDVSAAMEKLKSLAADTKMAALWKEISPGKKKAPASGTAGSGGSSSGAQNLIESMRAAVAAAAARAVEKSAAALAGA